MTFSFGHNEQQRKTYSCTTSRKVCEDWQWQFQDIKCLTKSGVTFHMQITLKSMSIQQLDCWMSKQVLRFYLKSNKRLMYQHWMKTEWRLAHTDSFRNRFLFRIRTNVKLEIVSREINLWILSYFIHHILVITFAPMNKIDHRLTGGASGTLVLFAVVLSF